MTEHDIELAKQAGFEIDNEGEPLIYFKEQWIDVTEELTKFAELIRAEKPQGEAVGVIKSEMRGEDGVDLRYAHLYEYLPEGTKLYTSPPDQGEEITKLKNILRLRRSHF
jgi:hypothetical protein